MNRSNRLFSLCLKIVLEFLFEHLVCANAFYLPLFFNHVQFYLDMKFVICACQGRYLSRHLHRVINEIISKAMEAFAATGKDPNR